jgi:hypothetical protein
MGPVSRFGEVALLDELTGNEPAHARQTVHALLTDALPSFDEVMTRCAGGSLMA